MSVLVCRSVLSLRSLFSVWSRFCSSLPSTSQHRSSSRVPGFLRILPRFPTSRCICFVNLLSIFYSSIFDSFLHLEYSLFSPTVCTTPASYRLPTSLHLILHISHILHIFYIPYLCISYLASHAYHIIRFVIFTPIRTTDAYLGPPITSIKFWIGYNWTSLDTHRHLDSTLTHDANMMMVYEHAIVDTVGPSPGSPPGMTASKSSKSSSFHSISSDDNSVLSDVNHFEDIGLDDDSTIIPHHDRDNDFKAVRPNRFSPSYSADLRTASIQQKADRKSVV